MKLTFPAIISLSLMLSWPSQLVAEQSNASEADVLNQAKTCTLIGNRLERLACFDSTFSTPVNEQASVAVAADLSHSHKPGQWAKMQQMEQQRSQQGVAKDGFIYASERVSDQLTQHWLSAPAIGTHGERPVLLLSCVNKISRVELYLPESQDISQLQVTVSANRRNVQQWQFDETGYMIRSGRGLPAIEVMKTMLTGRTMLISSDLAAVNDLHFDVADLVKAIAPMRKTCGW
ncbi:type VI secretion system-associated protein VasI [Motilimonas sp. KMU-193]|uniref:type VI secretion system-associated protein VasI n=1 Tax=Motilimonas sp. KMU-193 TaxID=3388668 RepID=UPI00396B1041